MKQKEQTDHSKKLKEGYTTGSCATATTKAALIALITGQSQQEATIYLPVGRFATFQMVECVMKENEVMAGTIKDAGDDPDATHKALIQSTVSWSDKSGVILDGGVGVGRVTKIGLPIPVGEAAINPGPRKMIHETVEQALKEYGVTRGIKIVISVPDGEEIAKKTLNGRLGIIGGISILGTRGIVKPFSTAAYKASIVLALKVARAAGCDHVVITTGGRSEKYGKKQYLELPEEAFIEMGDFVGFTIKECKRQGFIRVSMVGMMGKFSKVAQGIMMVHSKSAPIDFNFIADIAKEVGVAESVLEEIKQANTASQVGDMMVELGVPEYFTKLCDYCCQAVLKEAGGGLHVETSLYTLKGAFLGKAERDDRSN